MNTLTPLEQNAYQLPNGMYIHIKHEGEHEAGSFKQRGMDKLVRETADEVYCLASAGGAAIALARAEERAGKYTEIFVPCTTPSAKLAAIRRFGQNATRLHLVDGPFPDVQQKASDHAQRHGFRDQSAYNDELLIEAHGEVAGEIINQTSYAHSRVLFVPVGGGSLLAGTLEATAQSGDRVVGVQFSTNDSLARSIESGGVRTASKLDTAAEGSAANLKHLTYATIAKHRDRLDIVTVTPHDLADMVRREEARHYHECVAAYASADFASEFKRPELTGLLGAAGAFIYAMAHEQESAEWIAVETGSNRDETRVDALLDRVRTPMLMGRGLKIAHGAHKNF